MSTFGEVIADLVFTENAHCPFKLQYKRRQCCMDANSFEDDVQNAHLKVPRTMEWNACNHVKWLQYLPCLKGDVGYGF